MANDFILEKIIVMVIVLQFHSHFLHLFRKIRIVFCAIVFLKTRPSRTIRNKMGDFRG